MVIRITVEAIVCFIQRLCSFYLESREQNTSFTIIHLQLRRGLLKKGLQHRRSWMHMRKRIEYSGFSCK